MKYIFITIGILILAGSSTLLFNTGNDSTNNIEITESSKPVTQEELTEIPETEEEYEIDPSDMYSTPEISTSATTPLVTENEEKWLLLMREEEKLARDVYLTLGDMWGLRIFSNIASSEQTHTDAIKVLLDRYELTDPATDDTVGVFTDPEIQKLYDDLTKQGSESLLAALIVGATIEDLDIHDLDLAITESSKDDIIVVYQNLQKGSRNHMRAFVRQIERNGGTYTPQYISVSDYKTILSSPQEKGRIE